MPFYSRFSRKHHDDPNEDTLDLARVVSEVEYLLVLLVILFVVVPGANVQDRPVIVFGSVVCTAVIIVFHYALHNTVNSRLLGIEAVLMTLFITFVLWYTGKGDSPLVNLYLIVIISSALTLGQRLTILLAAFISVVLLYFDFAEYKNDLFSSAHISAMMRTLVNLYIFLLVSYLIIMLTTFMQRTRERIKMLSERDELTGLLNMRAFTNYLAREYQQSLRTEREFAVLMIDADNLKQVNDEFGHSAGDKLIVNIADIIQSVLRSLDVSARYGGDEFIVLLPEVSNEGAMTCAERIRAQVEANAFHVDGKMVSLSVSIGVAIFPEDGEDPEEIVNKADRALYNCKRQGKNKIAIAPRSTSEDKLLA